MARTYAVSWQDRALVLARKGLKIAGKLLSKVICIFDDIPFLLFKHAGNAGPYLLAGAGFLVFPVEGYEGVQGLKKAFKMAPGNPARGTKFATSIAKLAFSIAGFAVSAVLLAFILTELSFLASLVSISVPGTMAIISGVEWIDKIIKLIHLRKMPDSLEKKHEVFDAKRKLIFGGVYFAFALAITSLAALSVVSGLGILSLGALPATILIGVVVTALVVKIFELVDKHKKHVMTNAISEVLTNSPVPTKQVSPVAAPDTTKLLIDALKTDIYRQETPAEPQKQSQPKQDEQSPVADMHAPAYEEDYRPVFVSP